MRTAKLIVPVLLAGLAVVAGQAQTPQLPAPIASFHGIGDLPGGPTISTVRDATKHNGVIYAVGASVSINQPTTNTNAPVIWTWDGTNAVLAPLPEIATSFFASSALAVAITRDAAFIAGQVHVLSNKPAVHAVRVARGTPPSASTNVNLNASPYPAYTFLSRINNIVETTATTGATAISDDGAILYGNAVIGDATVVPRTDFTRAVRFDINSQTSTLIPVLDPSTHVGNNPVSRGTSADGSVMVGTSSGPGGSGIQRAFRYVHGTGVSAIPLLPGGTTNRSLAVSPDGNLTLAVGPSTSLPRGEVYIHNAATNAVTRLGSPMTPWQASAVAGMTADGSVVAITFSALPVACAPTPCTPPTPSRNAYIRNANGWFHFTNVLTEAGVDIWQNWESIQINGMSPDGTLVFGQARHNEELEGFVAEFPAGYLAAFDMPAVAPADTSIVGVWRLTDPDAVPGLPSGVTLAFLADGTFFHIEAANDSASAPDGAPGFERGRYFWNAATGALSIAILQDTNGDIGFSDLSGHPGFVATIVDDSITFSVTGCVPSPEVEVCAFTATRVTGTDSIVGGWIFGNPVVEDSSSIIIFLGNNEFYMAQDGGTDDPGGFDGIEWGTWAWNAGTGDISTTVVVDTNGDRGFSDPAGLITAILSRDKLQLGLTDTGDTDGTFTGIRIVDSATVVPVVTVNPATVNGAIGTEFTYYIQATYAQTYGAAGLPAGLAVDTTTGKITGTPTAAGSFNVTLSATNTFGATDTDILTIVIPSPGTTVATGSAGLWIGLKNSDDVGTKFDLRVEVLKNGGVVGSGQLDNVVGGSSGFNNAVLRTISTAMGSTTYASNDVLGVRLSVRIAAASSHRSGTARLWLGDAAANSRIDTVTNGAAKAFYLTNGFTLAAAPGPGPKATVDVTVDRAVGGNAFKPFGTWTFTF